MISLLLGVALLTFISLVILPMIGDQLVSVNRANGMLSLNLLRNNLATLVRSDLAWNYMKSDSACNPSLTCLKKGTDCEDQAQSSPINKAEGHAIRCLYDFAGNKIFDAREASHGFKENGLPCNANSSGGGFKADPGNGQCPYRPILTWSTDCTSGCTYPPLKINITFQYEPEQDIPYNPERHAIEVLR